MKRRLWLPRMAGELWHETDGGLFGRPCQTCCESCSIFSDDFNRADDTDLGADWSEVSGSWSISSNTLVTSSTSAVLIMTQASDMLDVRVFTQARGATDDRLRLIFAYEDSSNYWYAEWRVGSSKACDIVQLSGGSPTTVGTANITTSASTYYRVSACVIEGRAMLQVYTTVGVWVGSVLATSGTPAAGSVGLGTGSQASAIIFDSFSMDDLTAGCNGSCGICLGCAGTVPIAWDLVVPGGLVAGSAGGGSICTDAECSAIAGATWRLYWCPRQDAACVWSSNETWPCGGTGVARIYLAMFSLGSFSRARVEINHHSSDQPQCPGSFEGNILFRDTDSSGATFDCTDTVVLAGNTAGQGRCSTAPSDVGYLIPVF